MEKLVSAGCTGLGAVLPLDAGWSDVGAWDALWEIGAKDGDGNALTGDVMTVGSAMRLIYAGRLPARQRAPRAPRDG
jgi:mannose-1-phosphate guanylyltransferase